MWRMRPPPGVRLTCVSNCAVATYSGMLPGVLAGQYPRQRMEIDLVRLCAASHARLVVSDVCGLEVAGQKLLFTSRPPLPFDVLSIGVGSVPTYEGVEVVDGTRLLPVKPMQTFLDRLDERLRQASDERRGAPVRVAVVGGGVGSIELALCLPSRLRTLLGDDVRIEETIVSGNERIVPGSLEGTARRIQRMLERRGIGVAAGPPRRSGRWRTAGARPRNDRGRGSHPLGDHRCRPAIAGDVWLADRLPWLPASPAILCKPRAARRCSPSVIPAPSFRRRLPKPGCMRCGKGLCYGRTSGGCSREGRSGSTPRSVGSCSCSTPPTAGRDCGMERRVVRGDVVLAAQRLHRPPLHGQVSELPVDEPDRRARGRTVRHQHAVHRLRWQGRRERAFARARAAGHPGRASTCSLGSSNPTMRPWSVLRTDTR